MFKVNNKHARTTSFSSVSIVELEQVNVTWGAECRTLPNTCNKGFCKNV